MNRISSGVYCLFFLIWANVLPSQGFIRTDDLSLGFASYHNMIIDNDTIYMIGYFLDTVSPNKVGLHFTQLDTFGTPLHTIKHIDPEAEYWAATYHQAFIKLKNNLGYAILGNFYGTGEGYLLRLDKQGNFLSLKKYPKPPTFRTNYWLILKETKTGLLAGVSRQLENYDLNIYLFNLDFDGNIIWEKELGSDDIENISDILVKDDNEYVITGVFIKDNIDPSLSIRGPVFYGIDSTGSMEWQWQNSPSFSEGAAKDVQIQENGDWLYSTYSTYYHPIGQVFYFQAKMVRRTANFDLVWEHSYGQPATEGNGSRFFHVQPHPTGGYVGVGQIQNHDENDLRGYMIRTNGDGVLQWERFDTAFSREKWTAVGFLSSGSIIACGLTDNFQEGKTYSWLIKISPDGCVDTLNCATVGTTHEAGAHPLPAVKVFPNPSTGFINITLDDDTVDSIIIYSLDGKLLMRTAVAPPQSVDLSGLISGTYVLKIVSQKGKVYHQKVVILGG